MVFKNLFLTALFLIISHSLFAQIGIVTRYSTNNFNKWADITRAASGGPLWQNHLEFAVDYWFKPGEYRAEYLVELSYLNKKTTLGTRTYSLAGYGFGVKSNLYIFDFLGDCDCPTFSKDGGIFKKGFFLQWNAHAAYWQKNANLFPDAANNLAIDVGAGLGFDIGISELLTISPVVTYQYFPWLTWEQFGFGHQILTLEDLNSKITAGMFKVGIRVGFRPDFLKEKRVLRR